MKRDNADDTYIEPVRRLAAAVIRQAVLDAKAGDERAAAWLVYDAPLWTDVIEINDEALKEWAERILAQRESERIREYEWNPC